ncbi:MULTISPECIES: MFS transporter [Streptomyces]|uniref:MFS transporter n=1 Tax=Streptomyces eurythermus TaxID=42237 RepID=A0ABW6YS30_9ACTN|nr:MULTISPECIES: MFS transporter [Streptomyces]QIS74353.1 MFS transporter [Streptomyces sp. DSM 40868]WDM15090.1 MFS transporter [Streptomyces lavenduligriseus]
MNRRVPLLTLVVVTALSSAGTAASMLAFPWFVLRSTGSGTSTGTVAAAETVGLLCSAVLAGPLVDRLPARSAGVAADLLTALALGLVPLLHGTTGLPLPVLALLALLTGVFRGPADTAKQVLAVAAMRRAGTPVERGTSAMEGARRIGLMAGAPLGGVLVAAVGPVLTLLTDGAALLLSALLVLAFLPGEPPARSADEGSYAARLREGFVSLRADRLMCAMVGVLLVSNALDSGLNAVLYPAYGTRVLHSSSLLGVMVTAIGAGALVGTALHGWLGQRWPRRKVFVACFVLLGALRCVLLAQEPTPALLLGGLAVSGIGSGIVNPLMMSVAYERVPEAVRARVFGLIVACALAATPLGALAAGVLIDRLDVPSALLVFAGVYGTIALAPLMFPVWRELDASRPDGSCPDPVGQAAGEQGAEAREAGAHGGAVRAAEGHPAKARG